MIAKIDLHESFHGRIDILHSFCLHVMRAKAYGNKFKPGHPELTKQKGLVNLLTKRLSEKLRIKMSGQQKRNLAKIWPKPYN